MIAAKQLELVAETFPNARSIGVLVKPNSPNAGSQIDDLRAAAVVVAKELRVVTAASESDLKGAFSTFAQARAGAAIVLADTLFTDRTDQLVTLAADYAVPTIYNWREAATRGGLMSYGTSLTAAHRLTGAYVGRILKGEKPSELPVQQSTEIVLILNLKTAKTLGITFPLTLLGRADEAIE